MASQIPALRAKFGSTEYFLVNFKASEFVNLVRLPKEIEGWDDLTVEERWQREINFNRVKKLIAPYLASDKDRFFGAFIVDVLQSDEMEFEPAKDFAKGVSKVYERLIPALGVLHLSGSEILVPLDGQHRLAALKFAIEGRDEKGKEIQGLDPTPEVGTDEVAAILVRHDDKVSRKIFNKVNRYAKPTSLSENLITADDDAIAVLAREVVQKFLASRIVNISSNTLTKKAREFTTLGTIADVCELGIVMLVGDKIDRTRLPDKAKLDLYSSVVTDVWEAALGEVKLFRKMVADMREQGDAVRIELREKFLLGKPLGQATAIYAALILAKEGDQNGSVGLKEAFDRLNLVDWSLTSSEWQGVLMNGKKIRSGKTARNFAAQYIAMRLGWKCTPEQRGKLIEAYRDNLGDESATLPKSLV